MQREFTYEVAISFAEEDRNAALALAVALKLAGIQNVYYYLHEYQATWGQELEARLAKIFAEEARYAVVLFSKSYFQKKFAMVELKSIQVRMEREKNIVYMLPVLLEDCPLEKAAGIFSFGYLRWNYNPDEIAGAVGKILGKEKKQAVKDLSPATASIFVKGSRLKGRHIHIGDEHEGPAAGGQASSIAVVDTNYLRPGELTLYTLEKRNELIQHYRLIPDPAGT